VQFLQAEDGRHRGLSRLTSSWQIYARAPPVSSPWPRALWIQSSARRGEPATPEDVAEVTDAALDKLDDIIEQWTGVPIVAKCMIVLKATTFDNDIFCMHPYDPKLVAVDGI